VICFNEFLVLMSHSFSSVDALLFTENVMRVNR